MSDDADQVLRGLVKMGRDSETAMFTGWAQGRWECRSACCNAETYVKFGDYYAGVPSCKSCDRTLGPDDMRYSWLPPRKLWETTMENPWPNEPTPAPGPLRKP